MGRGGEHGPGALPGEAGGRDPFPRGKSVSVLSAVRAVQGHLQGQRRNDLRQHGQRDLPGRAGKLHYQGNIRELAGKGHNFHADRGPLPWAVGKLQPEHPAAGPGADDPQRAGYHAGRQVHFAVAGPAPVPFVQIRFENDPKLQVHGRGRQQEKRL